MCPPICLVGIAELVRVFDVEAANFCFIGTLYVEFGATKYKPWMRQARIERLFNIAILIPFNYYDVPPLWSGQVMELPRDLLGTNKD
jgi:hypothetical protein